MIRFYFDFISPYAYLAAMKVEEFGVPVDWRPVLLSGLLNYNDQKGPAEIPAKRLYTFKNVIRVAHEHGIPIQPPVSHPFNPLLALRLVTAVNLSDWIKRLFQAAWNGGPGIETREQILQSFPEPEVAQALELAETSAIKEKLRANTQEAIDRDVFGVPSLEVGPEIFWGFDSFPHVRAYLEGRDVVKKDELERWLGVRATAHRIRRR